MGRKKNTTIEIAEGAYLKRKDADSVWHYYFRLNNQVFRKTTKTKDKTHATLIALQHYQDVKNKRHNNLQLERVSFRALSKRYLAYIKSQSKHKYHSETTQRHFIPFFKKFDDVSKITNKDIYEYIVERQNKSDGKIANQTVNRENSVLKQMLQHGIDCGWISKEIRVKPLKDAKSRRRPHFTLEEYNHLLKVSRARAKEYEITKKKKKDQKLSDKQRGRLTQQHWSRNLLRDVIIILANTGLRVGELRTVRWKDVNFQTGEIQLHHAGKVKSSRRVIMRGYAPNALQRILDRRKEYISKNDGKFSDTEKVQSLPNGKVVLSMKKGFRELIKACAFNYSTPAEKHSLTSLRHTFATFRLTDKNGQRASTRALSKQMGTSEKMIEQHYGHDTIDDYKNEITGTQQTHNKDKARTF